MTLQSNERPQRYEIVATIHFRVLREKKWRDGVIQNISTSGVLIRTNDICPVDTNIEMRFGLPVDLPYSRAAEVYCRGVVVRSSQSHDEIDKGFIAATIEQSRLIRATA